MQQPDDQHLFSRTERILGADAMSILNDSFVVVVGLGAVGSYCVEALARMGIGAMRVVDFDIIQPSDINRQLLATHSSLGKPKAVAAAERIKDINPNCRVETLESFAHRDSFDKVLAGTPDIVVDAIDALNPKAALISECDTRKLPLVCSMGAAMRKDPTQICIAPLYKTHTCPLARQLRKRLKKLSENADPLCVFSGEHLTELGPDAIASDDDSPEDYYSRGRKRRTLGSLATLTGIFGLALAQLAIDILLQNKRS